MGTPPGADVEVSSPSVRDCRRISSGSRRRRGAEWSHGHRRAHVRRARPPKGPRPKASRPSPTAAGPRRVPPSSRRSAGEETAEACFGLAMALWWLGENQRQRRAVQPRLLAVPSGRERWSAPCSARSGWRSPTRRTSRTSPPRTAGSVGPSGCSSRSRPGRCTAGRWVARAYRMTDLDAAEELTRAGDRARRAADDVDLELVARSQLGLVPGRRETSTAGSRLLDEAMAAVLAGERSTLDTVVYACCDMLNACELTSDIERATQWCEVADDFVASYGCPFLYAECRIYYGSVLTAKGRWPDAERELEAGARITDGACPGLHSRALVRLAALRIRQGRLEEAEQLLAGLGHGVEVEGEVSLLTAALTLARGDAAAAGRMLEQRLRHLDGPPLAPRRRARPARRRLVGRRSNRRRGRRRPASGRRRRPLAQQCAHRRALAAGARGRVGRRPRRRRGGGRSGGGARRMVRRWSCPSRWPAPASSSPGRSPSTEPEAAVDHARRGTGHLRSSSARPRWADRAAAFLRSVGVVPRTGPKGTGVLTEREQEVLAAARRRAVESRDRRAPARQPQDGVAPREQHPRQARTAEPGRGRRPRRRRCSAGPTARPLDPEPTGPRPADGATARCSSIGRRRIIEHMTTTAAVRTRSLPDPRRGRRGLRDVVRARRSSPSGHRSSATPPESAPASASSTWPAAPGSSPGPRPTGSARATSSASTSTRRCSPSPAGSDPTSTGARAMSPPSPSPDGDFDAVLCQMALMFFPDRVARSREMARVAAPGGTVAVLVPAGLDVQPAYGPFVDMAARARRPRGTLAVEHLLRVRRPRRARRHCSSRPGCASRPRSRMPGTARFPVRRRARGHRGRQHAVGRAHHARGQRPDPRRRPHRPRAVGHRRRRARGALPGRRRRGPKTMTDPAGWGDRGDVSPPTGTPGITVGRSPRRRAAESQRTSIVACDRQRIHGS